MTHGGSRPRIFEPLTRYGDDAEVAEAVGPFATLDDALEATTDADARNLQYFVIHRSTADFIELDKTLMLEGHLEDSTVRHCNSHETSLPTFESDFGGWVISSVNGVNDVVAIADSNTQGETSHSRPTRELEAQSSSDTNLRITDFPLHREIKRLLEDAVSERFEIGMRSNLSRGLQELYSYKPKEVLHELMIIIPDCESATTAEVMQWAGEQESKDFREHVVRLLLYGLEHTSSLVRDSAALSLGHLEGTNAINHLTLAIAREPVPELREDIKDLVASLQR